MVATATSDPWGYFWFGGTRNAVSIPRVESSAIEVSPMRRCACVALVLSLASCPLVGAETAEQQAIRAADLEWARVFAARDLDRSVAVCTPDAAVLAPNAPRASGHKAIRELFQE